jgi:hypothetical protein
MHLKQKCIYCEERKFQDEFKVVHETKACNYMECEVSEVMKDENQRM